MKIFYLIHILDNNYWIAQYYCENLAAALIEARKWYSDPKIQLININDELLKYLEDGQFIN